MKKLVGAAPWIFIVIWSSGFVVAKYGFEDADSLFFLALRLLLAAGILFLLTLALRQPIRLSKSDLAVVDLYAEHPESINAVSIKLTLYFMVLPNLYTVYLNIPACPRAAMTVSWNLDSRGNRGKRHCGELINPI